ncbi:Nociceptin receptor [Trichoplax sp. H2]|nr:Nociceptin receptor [Trichoplax sp. H2]|eukprot:RDD47158.1 Nociceptin receptor [Trichoplax sp. H2]
MALAIFDIAFCISVILVPNSTLVYSESILVPLQSKDKINITNTSTNILLGTLYCSFIASEYLVWTSGIASIYTVTLLSIERYYIIQNKVRHRALFTPNRTKWMIMAVTISSGIVNMPNIFHSSLSYGYIYDQAFTCIWQELPIGKVINNMLYLLLFLTKFFLPSCTLVVCYAATVKKLHQLFNITSCNNVGRFRNKLIYRRVVIITFISSMTFMLCWTPSQIYFTLMNFQLLPMDDEAYLVTKILILINCCFNPVLYSAINQSYRKEFYKKIRKTLTTSGTFTRKSLVSNKK